MSGNRLRRLLCCTLSAAFACVAQNSRLGGVVTNSLTGEPVVRARVTLSNDSRKYTALTDAAGKFSLENITPDSYQTTAERAGFKAIPNPADAITLNSGKPHDAIEIRMTPLGAISGRVLDPSGQPLDSVTVIASRGPNPSRRDTTDETGHFQLGSLAPGKYRIRVEKAEPPFPPEIRTDGSVEVHYAATYYPGVLDAKSGSKVEVLPGIETPGIEIRMVPVLSVWVHGTLDGVPPGAKIIDLSITTPGDWDSGPDTEVAPDGTFQLWRLDPGHYRVQAFGRTANDHGFQTAVEEIDVAGSNIDNLRLRVIPFATITARLEFED